MTQAPSFFRRLLRLLFLVLAGASPAAGQAVGLPSDSEAAPVAVRAVPQRAEVSPGDQVPIAVVLEHAEGFHTWPNEPVLPPGLEDFGPIPTTISVGKAMPDLAEGAVRVGEVQWPEPHEVTVNFGTGPTGLLSYAGRAVAYIPVVLGPDVPPGELTLPITVAFQACNETMCLPPEEVEVLVKVLVVADPMTARGGPGADPALFSGFDPSVFAALATDERTGGDSAPPDGESGGAGPEAGAPESAGGGAAAAQRTFFGIAVPRPDSAAGIAVLALLAGLGGFILNLTPCVLPVIPIKVMIIRQHAGTPGRSLYLGLWMAVGVVAFWLAIGLPAAFVSGFADPSRLFGFWWITLGIGLLIGVMGLGIMGLFNLTLPQSVYAVNPKADNASGSFLFGVMTGVLGLPCFGFVAGALLAGATTLPPLVVVVIFVALGAGMAAPYLVLSAKPSLVDRIPRTGPASELVKQVMGLLLLAAAAYFVGAGLIALVSERPYLAKQLHWWTVALFSAAGGAWLVIRTVQITRRPLPRVVAAAIAIVIGGAALGYASTSTSQARANYEELQAKLASAGETGGLVTGTWIEYSEPLLKKALDAGHVVVLDFTAEWCINCRFLKTTVLNRDPVKPALNSDGVVLMTVDLTSTDAPGWKKLRDLGQTGIPLLVVYGPATEQPWQANAYTPQMVLEALSRARNGAGAEVSLAPAGGEER